MPGAERTPMQRSAAILTLVLLAEAVLYYTALGRETIPAAHPLEFFARDFAGWQMLQEGVVDKETQAVLRADDILNRSYGNASRPVPALLFVAYFKTQRTGQTPHSPKNCLPGAGWEPISDSRLEVPVAAEPGRIRINRYVVERGDAKSVVLYWYQARHRVIASEYASKFWLVLDSIRYHRSDLALVRVVVPVAQGDEQLATAVGVEFVQAVYPLLHAYLPA